MMQTRDFRIVVKPETKFTFHQRGSVVQRRPGGKSSSGREEGCCIINKRKFSTVLFVEEIKLGMSFSFTNGVD